MTAADRQHAAETRATLARIAPCGEPDRPAYQIANLIAERDATRSANERLA